MMQHEIIHEIRDEKEKALVSTGGMRVGRMAKNGTGKKLCARAPTNQWVKDREILQQQEELGRRFFTLQNGCTYDINVRVHVYTVVRTYREVGIIN